MKQQKNSITLVTGTEHTRAALLEQLQEFIPEKMKIRSYAIDEGLPGMIRDDLVIVSSNIVKEELEELDRLDPSSELLIAKRTINYEDVAKILRIPKGTEVLFVNDVQETALESIQVLKELGIDELIYTPYYPGYTGGFTTYPKIAITPGEPDKAPDFIEEIYNIGPRVFDFTTIAGILNRLDLLDQSAEDISKKYLTKIVSMSKRIAEFSGELASLNQHLNSVIDGLNDGLLVYDDQGEISVLNENLKKIIGLPVQETAGRKLKDVLYHKPLIGFLMAPGKTGEEIFSFEDTEVAVRKIYLQSNNAYIATFKNVQETIASNEQLKRELIQKGHFAKYTFEDIIGKSEAITRIKEIVKKLSKTDLTILMEGESGTGKELFASAIHHYSNRSKKPFLAVNFSALPDELIESELFGYEEGAFTGAKKGGRIGLFEQADGGTIFLDEIGDISMKVQARLLRVLQEKEVMPIGGHQIKTVDVRIVAATNKDLSKMVREGDFRRDLYYRLKMGYVKIPPLRHRKEDLQEMIQYFVTAETQSVIKINPKVIETLLDYEWYGNVRELKNTLEYMLAVRDGNRLELKDIPDRGFFMGKILANTDKANEMQWNAKLGNGEPTAKDAKREPGAKRWEMEAGAKRWEKEPGTKEKEPDAKKSEAEQQVKKLELDPKEEEIRLLQEIYRLMKTGDVVGREKLADAMQSTPYPLTSHQIRTKLNRLERLGFIIKKRGKHGTALTEQGLAYLNTKGEHNA